jgi:hypothetical protein
MKSQPLIAQPVNALARFMPTANSELYVLAEGVLRYLEVVKSRKIICVLRAIDFPSCLWIYSDTLIKMQVGQTSHRIATVLSAILFSATMRYSAGNRLCPQ